MKEIKEIKLFDLESSGEYLFVYSDRFNIFLFFFDREENKFYKITTDKFFTIENIDEIEFPEDFENFTSIKFFKPFCKNGNEYTFIGIVQFDDNRSYKFKIENRNEVIYTEEIDHYQSNGIINNLKCLKSIDIFNYIQKKNRIFFVGYDDKYKDYFFAIANIEDDKLERIYPFYSDYGDIIPFAINIDVNEGRIYIVGKIEYLDDDNNVTMIKPFFEFFSLN